MYACLKTLLLPGFKIRSLSSFARQGMKVMVWTAFETVSQPNIVVCRIIKIIAILGCVIKLFRSGNCIFVPVTTGSEGFSLLNMQRQP
jgi:hypothetical protein